MPTCCFSLMIVVGFETIYIYMFEARHIWVKSDNFSAGYNVADDGNIIIAMAGQDFGLFCKVCLNSSIIISADSCSVQRLQWTSPP